MVGLLREAETLLVPLALPDALEKSVSTGFRRSWFFESLRDVM